MEASRTVQQCTTEQAAGLCAVGQRQRLLEVQKESSMPMLYLITSTWCAVLVLIPERPNVCDALLYSTVLLSVAVAVAVAWHGVASLRTLLAFVNLHDCV